MEFKFKRKYTLFFFTTLLIHLLLVLFWITSPQNLFKDLEEKKMIFLIALINIELILIFYIGLFRKKYYAYHDKIHIKRSFFPDLTISYKDIIKIKERNNDSILLGFGHLPSFTIYYKTKKYTIRSDNTNLLLKVIKNEIDISKFNDNNKKLTK